MATVTGYDPAATKVFAPVTVKAPPPTAVTVPAELVPSPQVIVACSFLAAASGQVSVTTATTP